MRFTSKPVILNPILIIYGQRRFYKHKNDKKTTAEHREYVAPLSVLYYSN